MPKRHIMTLQSSTCGPTTAAAAATQNRDFVLFTVAQLSSATSHSTDAGDMNEKSAADATPKASSASGAVQVHYNVAAAPEGSRSMHVRESDQCQVANEVVLAMWSLG